MFDVKLVPKRVTIESTFKPYGDTPGGGLSSGSTIGVECEVPGDIVGGEFKRVVFVCKEQLDLMVLTAEYAKGAMTQARYQSYKGILKKNYDKLLGRNGGPG